MSPWCICMVNATLLIINMSIWNDTHIIGLPNHDLHYLIGENFCLERAVENSYFIINCSLEYPVTPLPDFQFSIFQAATLLFDTDALNNFTSNITELEKILSISGTMLPDKLGITVVCNVSNTNGYDTASTEITLCSKFQCESCERLAWPQWPDSHHACITPQYGL